MAPLIASSPSSSSPSSSSSSSSTKPSILVLGSAGGSRIITAITQLAISALLYNLTAYTTIAKARLHDQLIPNEATFEWEYDNGTVDAMRGKGHE
ncbi:MAG: hypothetical protein Q9169_007134, partial [Polycauliona sp. 2 TL-2023]